MTISRKKLWLEILEDRGYANGYRDGRADGRVEGRRQGIQITQRRIAQALQREGVTSATIAKVLKLSPVVIESELPGVSLFGGVDCEEPVKPH